MKSASTDHFLYHANRLLFLLGTLLIVWSALNRIEKDGWTEESWVLVVAVVIFGMTLGLDLLQMWRRRAVLLRFFAENRHVVDVHTNGKVVVAGHRISLYQLLKDLRKFDNEATGLPLSALYPLEKLSELYPSVDRELLQRVVAFCRAHPREIGRYFIQQQKLERKSHRLIERRRTGVGLEELRRLRDEKVNSGSGTVG